VTIREACELPALLVAVIVYWIVTTGDTVSFPADARVLPFQFVVTVVALATFQESETGCPGVITEGLATKYSMTGLVAGVSCPINTIRTRAVSVP